MPVMLQTDFGKSVNPLAVSRAKPSEEVVLNVLCLDLGCGAQLLDLLEKVRLRHSGLSNHHFRRKSDLNVEVLRITGMSEGMRACSIKCCTAGSQSATSWTSQSEMRSSSCLHVRGSTVKRFPATVHEQDMAKRLREINLSRHSRPQVRSLALHRFPPPGPDTRSTV